MTDSDKKSLRRRFTALRDSIPQEERQTAEARILERLTSLPAWRKAPLICGYMSVGSELNTAPIWARAIAEGKRYALPVTLTGAGEGKMIFRPMETYSPDRLIPARFGIPEPPEAIPPLSAEDFGDALILVPGLAFDEDGYRLGYGGGYYDRFLAGLRAARIPFFTVGAAFSVCRTENLPHLVHDMPVDCIIDERRMTVAHGIPNTLC